MINEETFVSYVERLAVGNKDINHTQNGGNSFFYIDEPDNMDEFDRALRSSATSPAFLLVADDGEFADNNSENHTQESNGQFYVVARTTDDFSKRAARTKCLQIVLDFLAKMKVDARRNKIVSGKIITFRIDKIRYQKVGPMNAIWYGYTVWFSFTCPFGFSVNSGTWREIDTPVPPEVPGSLSADLG